MINDGSTDETEEICLKYQTIYKKNIIYIRIEHSGVSKARNVGMNYANGTFINFLDSDDKWDHQAFEYILLFFKNFPDVDFVAGRIKFFEAENGYHPLDYKFYQTRIVNLNEEYNCIQLSASSAIFRKSILEGKNFEENILFCEDARFVNSILLVNPKMGLIKEAIYNYRRRSDFTSAVQKQKQNLNFYLGTPNLVFNYLVERSKKIYNEVIPFIQFLIGYDILFRIQSPAYKFLDANNLKKYILLIDKLLKQINDKYILEQKILNDKYKLFILSKKYHRDLRYDFKYENNSFFYLNNKVIDLQTEKKIIELRVINMKNDKLYLEALDSFWIPREQYNFFCKIENKTYIPNYSENPNYDFITMYGVSLKGRIISFEIPLEIMDKPQILYFYISYLHNNIEIFPFLGMFSHIPPISHGYYVSENYIIKFIEKHLIIFRYSRQLENEFEHQYCYELQRVKKNYIIKIRNHLKYRNTIDYYKLREIWIINDRRDRAADNGEFFFRYLRMKNPKGIKAYFAIEKNSYDFKRLQKIGNIIDLNSNRYKIIALKTNKIISSISDNWVYNPLNNNQIYIRDLLNFEIIFLQNGIIKDDLSKYLNKFDKNFNLFVTSSEREYKSILEYKYGYNKNNVILTGMPRYDNLLRLKNKIDNKKNIIIMPTWRINIQGSRDLLPSKIKHSEIFKYTKFFKFYNNLINDERLLLIMKQNNYTGTFCLHPFFEAQWIDFTQNEIFSILEKCDYQELLLEGSLLITDYSSIFFDFGFLRKPVIYTHFDYEEYRNTHYKKGYFNYNLDGFGPICRDINCTVNEIIFELENNCLLRKKFLLRINKFFKFSDENSSERIFHEIIKTKSKIIIKYRNSKFFYFVFVMTFILFFKIIKRLKTINEFIIYN